MDIQSLRHLVALSKTENVRKAAALLRITPPGLSKSIKQLEGELGYPLVARSGRNIVLTDRARLLSQRAQALISEFDKLRAEQELARAADFGRTRIRIASFDVFSTYFLKTLTEALCPEARLTLHEGAAGEIERAVLDGHADYGITYMAVPMPGLEFDRACSAEMGVFTLKGAFAGMKQSQLPFVVPAHPLHGVPSRIRGSDGWPDDAYARNVRYQVTLIESGLELVRQGLCAGYFPVFIARAHNERIRPQLGLERRASPYAGRKCFTEVHIVRRRSDPESRVHRQIAKALRLYCKGD